MTCRTVGLVDSLQGLAQGTNAWLNALCEQCDVKSRTPVLHLVICHAAIENCCTLFPWWSKQWPKQDFSIAKCSRAVRNIQPYKWSNYNEKLDFVCVRHMYFFRSLKAVINISTSISVLVHYLYVYLQLLYSNIYCMCTCLMRLYFMHMQVFHTWLVAGFVPSQAGTVQHTADDWQVHGVCQDTLSLIEWTDLTQLCEVFD